MVNKIFFIPLKLSVVLKAAAAAAFLSEMFCSIF